MKKLDMVKTVGGIIISVGVGAIIGNAIKCTTPSNIGTIKKVCMGIGGFVLSSLICDAATDYAGKQFDNAVKQVKNMVEKGELES